MHKNVIMCYIVELSGSKIFLMQKFNIYFYRENFPIYGTFLSIKLLN